MRFSKLALQKDVLHLANLLIESHPDPYSPGGGPLAFRRRIQGVLEGIPEEGMTAMEFLRLLRPIVASIQDSHTSIRLPARTHLCLSRAPELRSSHDGQACAGIHRRAMIA